VNNGAAMPPVVLIDENGKEQPPIEVPVVQDPGEGDLINFVVADPGTVTVVNLGSSLLIQGIREGKTTVQAKTLCGDNVGQPFGLEILRCDKKTVDEISRALKEAEGKLDQNRQLQDETARNPEYTSARDNIDATKERILSTAAKTLAQGYNPARAVFEIGEVIGNALAGKYSRAGMGALSLWAPFLPPVAAYKSWETIQTYREYYNDIINPLRHVLCAVKD